MDISNEFSIYNVIDIAKEAGDRILDIYNEGKDAANIKYKDDNSPLTSADLASNNVIVSALKKITPNIKILSEEGRKESYNERSSWNRLWIIDPLDGTKEFIKRNGEFTVNIGLIENSKPVLGVVYAPVIDTLWFGDGNGSFKKVGSLPENRIHVSAGITKRPVRVVVSRSHLNDKVTDFISQFNDYKLLRVGSSIKMCLVADGSADIYPRLGPTMEWDSAASHAIINNAGGSMINIDNRQDLIYNKRDLHNPWFIVNSNIKYSI